MQLQCVSDHHVLYFTPLLQSVEMVVMGTTTTAAALLVVIAALLVVIAETALTSCILLE